MKWKCTANYAHKWNTNCLMVKTGREKAGEGRWKLAMRILILGNGCAALLILTSGLLFLKS